jgi:hypothetical protein
MNLPEPTYYLDGDEPPVHGTACSGFYLMQHQVDGALSDPASSAYFNFNETWLQLCFDGNTIFWRKTAMPGEPVNDRLSSVLVLLNLNEMEGVVGSTLGVVRYWGSEDEVGASLQFASGVEVVFTHLSHQDTTLVAANNSVEKDRPQAALVGSLRGFAATAAPHVKR